MTRLQKLGMGFVAFVAVLGLAVSAFANSSFHIQASIDKENNAVDLSWMEPDKAELYTYRLYKKEEGESEFQSISTTDLDKGTVVKTLNVYPSYDAIPYKETGEIDLAGKPLKASAMLKEWIGEYGQGAIEVDAINQHDFDANPDKYLKDKDGNYKYDVVAVGFWNIYSDGHLGDNGVQSLREFAESGRGLLTGHHHIGQWHLDRGMNQLKDLFGVKFVRESGYPESPESAAMVDYVAPEPSLGKTASRYHFRSNQLIAVKRGLLLEYPNYVAEEGRIFHVPLTHNSADFVTGDVWLEFYNATNSNNGEPIDLTELPDGTKGSKKAYLSTYNNTALIQTGHSSLDNGTLVSTEDEKKFIANTIFYLAQLTNQTSHKDRSGLDLAAPERVQNITFDPSTNTVKFPTPKDNGTTYEYFVEAIGQNSGKKKKSQTIKVTNATGVRGYSYVVDDKPDTVPDAIIDVTSNQFTLDLSKTNGRMLHIVAVDRAGNVSEVTHVDISEPKLVIQANSNTWTNKDVLLTVEGSGNGISKIRLPNGNIVSGKRASFTTSNNGVYTFYGLDQNNQVVAISSYVVKNIDRKSVGGYIVPNDGKWRNANSEVEIKTQE